MSVIHPSASLWLIEVRISSYGNGIDLAGALLISRASFKHRWDFALSMITLNFARIQATKPKLAN